MARVIKQVALEGLEKDLYIARPDFQLFWGEKAYRKALVAPKIVFQQYEPWRIELRIPNAVGK